MHALVAVDCGPLPYPNRGGVTFTGTTAGSIATYSCVEGYILVGDGKRECQADGKWSGEEPACLSKKY